jgi:hypothetical protein
MLLILAILSRERERERKLEIEKRVLIGMVEPDSISLTKSSWAETLYVASQHL